MSERQKAIIFDDGSLAFRLYQKEYSGTYEFQVIKVSGKPTDVPAWLLDSDTDSGSDTDSDIPTKIHLHFIYDDFIANNGELRTIVDQLQMSAVFRNRIFLPYEGLDKQHLIERCINNGINIEIDEPKEVTIYDKILQNKQTAELYPEQTGIDEEVGIDDENFKTKSTGRRAKKKVSDV